MKQEESPGELATPANSSALTASPLSLTIAVSADLHWGIHENGDASTRALLAELADHPPDVLILAGDIGAGDDFARCLELFEKLPCRKALVPGNHDIWVTSADARGDSWQVYSQHLPSLSAKFGFHYLDHAPLILHEADLAVVGTMNWYDYSWAIDELPKFADDWEERLQRKRFLRGQHNDARFVRWPFTDGSFTAQAVAVLAKQLEDALRQVGKALVITHHPAFFGLNYPAILPPHLDQLLWRAFSGNRTLEKLLEQNADRIALVFSGHTHKARENTLAGMRGYNIGGDYGWKRLLTVKWPDGKVEAREFR